MKFQKLTAVRGALALVATGSALVLSACGAGQISQTANQLPAVNGANGRAATHVSIRDASLVAGLDGRTYVKFTASNTEEKGEDVTLQSVSVDGKNVPVSGETNIPAGCNLVAEVPSTVERLQPSARNTCIQYISLPTGTVDGAFMGGAVPAELTFSSGVSKVALPVVGQQPISGETHRSNSGQLETR